MAIKANTTYFVRRKGSTGNLGYLNIYGNSYTGDTQPVKLWEKVSTDPMQKWKFDANPESGAFLCTMCDLTRAINMYSTSTPNCTIWAKANNATDGLVKIVEHASGYYYIRLVNRNLYLTATSTANGTQVTWAAQNAGSSTQLWEFEEENTGNTSYTGILARNTSVPSATASSAYIINNIPDKQFSSGIENNVEFHPGCGFVNGTNFNTSSDGTKVKNALQKFVKKVFGSNVSLTDAQTCFYLFAERINNGAGNDFHTGVDIDYYNGASIYALFGGEVTYAGGSYGTVSVYNSTLNVTFNYVHMNGICVSVGDVIAAGAKIGLESNVSLDSIKPHLHFEVRPGRAAGPMSLINSPNTKLTTILPYGYMDGVL